MKKLIAFFLGVVMVATLAMTISDSGNLVIFTVPVTSTSSTTNGPSATEFATAGWVRNLLTGGTTILYNSGDTNSSGSFDTPVYSYIATAPAYGSRTYLQANLTNGVYFGSVMTTNKYLQLGGDVTVQPYISSSGGNASSYYTVHAEIYYSYDGSTLLGDWDSGVQSLVHGVTNGYSFTVPVPTTVSTNSTGFYIVRRMKIDQKFGTGDDIKMHYGTNYASKILLPTPTSVGANWVASGSTNSTLAGNATVNSIIMGTNVLSYSGTGLYWNGTQITVP